MKTIGKGFHGIVLRKTDAIARKYHTSKAQWLNEVDNLMYLSNIHNIDIGCTIPWIYDKGSEDITIDGRTYSHWVDMQLVPGKTASELMVQQLKTGGGPMIGASLGAVLFRMHSLPHLVVPGFDSASHDGSDQLLEHILNEKASTVLRSETDLERLEKIQEAADYLSARKQLIISEGTFSHSDLNMMNIIINDKQQVEGLVDWSGAGTISPSLSLYQLAREDIWPHVEGQYEKLGGKVQKDLMYAATTIHLAWSAAYWLEKGNKNNSISSSRKFDKYYELFRLHANRP